MQKHSKVALGLGIASLLAVSGGIDPADYETTPVEVQTAKGVVTCQLYREKQVVWDEAISIPPGMTIREGDQICVNEGIRRLKK